MLFKLYNSIQPYKQYLQNSNKIYLYTVQTR